MTTQQLHESTLLRLMRLYRARKAADTPELYNKYDKELITLLKSSNKATTTEFHRKIRELGI